MALQTFTAGQVLTAAQVTALQTNDFNQTVSVETASYTLVAADKGTRVVMNSASATTITVNTSLFDAGDTLQIHNIGAGVCTITAGTATVSTAGSLALPTNAGGTLFFTSTGVAIFFPTVAGSSASGLELINTTSFSGVSSVSLPANTFTSTFTNYQILVNITNGTASASIRLRASGSDASGSNYQFASRFINTSGVAANNASSASNTSFGGAGMFDAITNSPINIFFYNPHLAVPTTMSFFGVSPSTGSPAYGGGVHTLSTAFDSLTLINTANMSGDIRVYGLAK